MTGNDNPVVRKAALDSGCAAFLTKSFSVQELIGPLKKASAGRSWALLVDAFFKFYMSVPGTFETCRRAPRMSVYRGRPEVTGRWSARQGRSAIASLTQRQ